MLSKWAQKLRIPGPTASRRSESSAVPSSSAPENTLPVLPNPRPRPITPPPASHDSSSTDPSPYAYGLFNRVPIEVRRQILIEAFGKQTIHIDLVHGRPRNNPRGSSNKEHRLRRAPRAPNGSASGPALHKLIPKPKEEWRWYSSVCHADLPSGTQPWSRFAEPCDDSCQVADSWCDKWPGEAPGKCFIGVMGWLLACRQAYVEGMDVLWATNTFRVQDMVILRHAQQLFLPHRWASIPRLEVQCFFSPHGWMLPVIDGESADSLPLYSTRTSFHDLMRDLPPVLRNLQTLHISLISTAGRPFPPSDAVPALADLMKHVEAMLRQIPPTIVECTVAVPGSLYRISRDETIAEGRRPVEHFCRRQRERHWREMDAPTGMDGYWMQLGKTDLSPFAVVPTACFGTGAGRSWREDMDLDERDLILYGLHWL
ncbi:hypothetical protein CPLU01_10902 [Colletotrichum plurivorum]|uniref:DUF7730 domain-containing protein n=1 Tax=Colletotrichum plurivorum TaxID=2175906 RepID=A0A8H6K433_9PEZI|nr:hypothetical protein CPLU01_10902 [Colletotrichum plurivorum]